VGTPGYGVSMEGDGALCQSVSHRTANNAKSPGTEGP
jgi:hypothetical protein